MVLMVLLENNIQATEKKIGKKVNYFLMMIFKFWKISLELIKEFILSYLNKLFCLVLDIILYDFFPISLFCLERMVANKEQDDVLTKWLYDMIFFNLLFSFSKKKVLNGDTRKTILFDYFAIALMEKISKQYDWLIVRWFCFFVCSVL